MTQFKALILTEKQDEKKRKKKNEKKKDLFLLKGNHRV